MTATPSIKVKVSSSSITSASIDNSKPITYFRQVLSLLENPQLLNDERILLEEFNYKGDVLNRAKWLIDRVGSVGAYSASNGVPAIRDSIASFFQERDGFPADPSHIYLCAGATTGMDMLFSTFCAGSTTGVLVPMSHHALYSPFITVRDAHCIPYLVDKNGGPDLDSICSANETAKANGVDVRCIVIMNPGGPTTSYLSEKDIRSVLNIAYKERLVVIADEAHQPCAIGGFCSFKSILHKLQQENREYEKMELASLYSISRSIFGDSGHRAGFFELVGFDPGVEANIYKLASLLICAPVVGQCLVELVVNPPKPGQSSYELYRQELLSIQGASPRG
ncbi:hypothetical protein QWA68_015258 [Fusarium oxysporum]|nr:hypothetical protein QWA68_015258 [Fusarium oxysporum]